MNFASVASRFGLSRPSVGFGALVLLAATALYVGCDDDNSALPSGSGAGASGPGSGAGANTSCFGGIPDDSCEASEDCNCRDCQGRAKCTGGCTDDNACQCNPNEEFGGCQGPEDCSCGDCLYKINRCSPELGDCNSDPENMQCDTNERCTCPDCNGSPGCATCTDNGECVPAFEGCQCADCASHPDCSGGPASSSSSGGGGDGGTGGTPAAGGGGMGGT
jgi:hypothetical protein